jgi:hypothetical protein
MDYEVLYSRHARERMVLRGISRDEVEVAIQTGSKSRQGSTVVSAHRYFEVVYVVRGTKILVITVKPRW